MNAPIAEATGSVIEFEEKADVIGKVVSGSEVIAEITKECATVNFIGERPHHFDNLVANRTDRQGRIMVLASRSMLHELVDSGLEDTPPTDFDEASINLYAATRAEFCDRGEPLEITIS